MSAFDIGVLVHLTPELDGFAKAAELGFAHCQLCGWQPELYTDAMAQRVRAAAEEHHITIAAFWAGWTGPAVWDFLQGPATLGIVPPQHRAPRVAELKQGADFAEKITTPAVITHLGFLPEDPSDPNYPSVVETVRGLAAYCQERNLGFWFETGQETPVTLLRLIEDVALPNLGINLDTANLILYGKANTADSIDVFGPHVKNLHAKDGLYPTNGRQLGPEVRLGDGKADLPQTLAKLKQIGFTGEIIIEREITGRQQHDDIIHAQRYLQNIVATLPT